VGNESHCVAVRPGCDPEPVREFAVYDILEKRGFQVCLTNARDTKNLPGRKTDVQESQWLLKLHTDGLLRNSFRPPEQIRALRTVWRVRGRHVEEAGCEIQHMQKALTTMNVQLANAISDVSGLTGQAIIRAILKGERDPGKLAQLRHYRIQASEEEIARSLEGNGREDVLFELQQAVDADDFCQRQMTECGLRLQGYLGGLESRTIAQPEKPAPGSAASSSPAEGPPERKRKKKRSRQPRKNEPKFNLEEELSRICGVNRTTVDVWT
jgi:transposase